MLYIGEQLLAINRKENLFALKWTLGTKNVVLTIVIRKIANCTFTTCSKMQWSACNRKIATNHHFRICCQIYIFSK